MAPQAGAKRRAPRGSSGARETGLSAQLPPCMKHKPKLLSRRVKVIHNREMWRIRRRQHRQCSNCAQLHICKANAIITRMSETDDPHRPLLSADDPPLRSATLWLPDTSAPGFAAEARRQSAQVAQGTDEDHILNLLEDDIGWPDT